MAMNTTEKKLQAQQYVLDIAYIVEIIKNNLEDIQDISCETMEAKTNIYNQLRSILRYANRFKSLVIAQR